MPISFAPLFIPNVVNDAAPETLYLVPSVPGSNVLRNARIRFSNTTAVAATIQVWAVPSGGSVGDSTVCLPERSIAANDYLDIDIPVMGIASSIRAQAGTANSITASCLGGFVQS